MTWYEYTVSFADFPTDLANKLETEGWVRAESGYNTMKPSGYEIFVFPEMNYATRWGTDNGTTNFTWTSLRIWMRAGYNFVNHRPDTSKNGGIGVYRLVRNADYSSSTSGLLNVRGWIWNKGFALFVWPDPYTVTSGDKILQFIFCGEVQAVDAPANTVMLLVPTWEDQGDTGAMNIDSGNIQNDDETRFVHCLGDGYAYQPICLGFGVSRISNRVRAMPLFVWGINPGVGDEVHLIHYMIPEVRPLTFYGNIERDWDTFTTPDNQTFAIGPGLPNGMDHWGRVVISKRSRYDTIGGWYRVCIKKA